MDTAKDTSSNSWIRYGLIGFLFGLCIVVLSATGMVAQQIANPPSTPTPLPTPTASSRAILNAAYEALYTNRDPQLAIDTLSPHLEEFADPEELSEALQYLSTAELGLGHYQISAAYLDRLVQISPSPENYATLARTYDAAGDLKHALANYRLYLESDDPAMTDDIRQLVQDRINQIQAILTSFTPTPG